MKKLILMVTHGVALVSGVGLGIYLLPILTAPPAPSTMQLDTLATMAGYTGHFRRDLKDSDALHWGEGTLLVGTRSISLVGELAPGPNYKLYLSPQFVDTEAEFKRLKHTMVQVGDVRTFKNFIVPVPDGIEPARYTTAIVWCEAFQQFITAAQYR